jgi:hypothetical protein
VLARLLQVAALADHFDTDKNNLIDVNVSAVRPWLYIGAILTRCGEVYAKGPPVVW